MAIGYWRVPDPGISTKDLILINSQKGRCPMHHHDANVIGPMIVKLRYQNGWTQDDLVAKLQLVGCYMTRDILANLETRRSVATDKQIEFFAAVFGVHVGELFPASPKTNGEMHSRLMGMTTLFVTRHRNHRNGSVCNKKA